MALKLANKILPETKVNIQDYFIFHLYYMSLHCKLNYLTTASVIFREIDSDIKIVCVSFCCINNGSYILVSSVTVLECVFKFRNEVSSSGIFKSPNFPGLYPRSTECHYLFYAGENKTVHIEFLQYDIEGIPIR